jgi:hypothetical protein
MLIETTYRIVARSRLEALRFMFATAAGPDDPDAIRTRINDYLGGGPVAMALHEAAAGAKVNVRRFVEVMSAIALREQDDLAATAARQLESYPSHPLLLLASALGEARLPHADVDRFRHALGESMGPRRPPWAPSGSGSSCVRSMARAAATGSSTCSTHGTQLATLRSISS